MRERVREQGDVCIARTLRAATRGGEEQFLCNLLRVALPLVHAHARAGTRGWASRKKSGMGDLNARNEKRLHAFPRSTQSVPSLSVACMQGFAAPLAVRLPPSPGEESEVHSVVTSACATSKLPKGATQPPVPPFAAPSARLKQRAEASGRRELAGAGITAQLSQPDARRPAGPTRIEAKEIHASAGLPPFDAVAPGSVCAGRLSGGHAPVRSASL